MIACEGEVGLHLLVEVVSNAMVLVLIIGVQGNIAIITSRLAPVDLAFKLYHRMWLSFV